ncbi:restriction endonuclease subunit S [Cellvibrio polysaccharolyticus]|uniref:Restriction endonuclease subunit S n=1 Tax=Cellvibrio polysaccharolyticus TaxID=2082724 RepID=A0A928V4D4_9GAMM|nr:restriction endonuclease subunit S [Cellvibrio polysaccharolyticus]MBE8718553.1 restriction endonuclease subunit S [Cellvibrio polysaccharolyticus]
MESITSTPKYDQYIDSGYEWIGEIPQHWDLVKLGSCLSPVSVKNCPELPLLSITREQGVIERDVDDQESNHNFIPDDLSGYKKLEKGQFGMNKMKAWQGSYGVSKFTGIVSPAYFVFDFTKAINPEFFNWAIRSKLYVSFFGSASDGVRIGQWDLSKTRMKVIPFVLPSEEEQSLIANFLDKKTTQINDAIAIKEQQINLLKERKQIIIQQAVTQGLDLNVPMKDSGVDWIGKIPEHWEVRRAKYIFKKENRPVRLEDDVVTCFRDGQVTLRTNRRTEGFTFATKEHGYQGIRKGDLVIHAMDAFAGAIGVSDSDGKSSPVYSACTPVTGVKVNPKYYALYLRSLALGGFIESLAKGIRERSTDFRYKDFSELFFPLPDIETQNKVVLEIEKSHQEIDGGISVLTKQIEKIKEYKTSLINSAVTGKIKITPEMVEQ